MRIALVTDGIWPYVLGGMQKHSFYLCKYLAQQKVQVDLFHFNRSNYNIHRLEFFSNEEKAYIQSYVVDFPSGVKFPGAYIYYSYQHSKLIFNVLKDRLAGYDFIYTKGFTGWYLIQQKQNGSCVCPPIGVKFHGYEMFQKAPSFKIKLQQLLLLRWPVKKLSLGADRVFSYGGKITGIIKELGVSDAKIIELPSGVESNQVRNEFSPVSFPVKFLFLGRYERRKGIEELNESILKLSAAQRTKCEFHFIGPIPEDKKLRLEGVIYHGEIRDKLILKQKTEACDVLLCPSWSEGMPNSILEAMAAGLAVVATDVGAVNVLVDDETGWLIGKSSVAEISEVLNKILNSSPAEIELRKKMALQKIKNKFTWEVLIAGLIRHIGSGK